MQMDVGWTPRAMIRKVTCPIASDETSASLCDKLAGLGLQALVDTLTPWLPATPPPSPRTMRWPTTPKALQEEARIDWSMDAVAIERCIRAFNPGPSAGSTSPDRPSRCGRPKSFPGARPGSRHPARGRQQGIEVATGQGVLRLLTLQPPGKKAMSVSDLLNSRRDWFEPGTQPDLDLD